MAGHLDAIVTAAQRPVHWAGLTPSARPCPAPGHRLHQRRPEGRGPMGLLPTGTATTTVEESDDGAAGRASVPPTVAGLAEPFRRTLPRSDTSCAA